MEEQDKIARSTTGSRMAPKPAQQSATQKINTASPKRNIFSFSNTTSPSKPASTSTGSSTAASRPASAKPAASAPIFSGTARPAVAAAKPSTSQSVTSAKPTSGRSKSTKSTKSKSAKSKKLYLIIAGVVVASIVLIVAITMAFSRHGDDGGVSGDGSDAASEIATTEEENAITKQVMDKYVEVTVDGYQRVDNEDGLNDIVVIKIKNTSEERTNLALDVVALDKDDKVLDKTSLYAEGIEPGQTQIFEAFALSELTPDQLKSAHYKIYRANTYNLEIPQTESE